MATRKPKFSLIGAGRVGTAFALSLSAAGYPVASIVSRTGRPAIALARRVRCPRVSTEIAGIDPQTEFVLIAVPDDALEETAQGLARVKGLRFGKLFAAHSSGVHPARVLRRLEQKGAAVASIHPVQTFPEGKRAVKLAGIYYGIEGTPRGITAAREIVGNLGGKSLVVPEEMKPLYHVACVFASNYFAVFLNVIAELSRKLSAGWTDVFGPLMSATMANVVRESAPSVLTGPIVRGDLATVGIHLRALVERSPEFLPLYAVAGIEAARLSRQAGRISRKNYDDVVSLFSSFVRSMDVKKSRRK